MKCAGYPQVRKTLLEGKSKPKTVKAVTHGDKQRDKVYLRRFSLQLVHVLIKEAISSFYTDKQMVHVFTRASACENVFRVYDSE